MSEKLGRQEFNRIMMQHQRFVYRLAFTVVRSMEEADEVTQEVFVKLYKHIDRIEKPEAIKAWLARTALSTARDRLRWLKVRSWFTHSSRDADDVGTPTASPERLAAANERTRIIGAWSAAHLSPKERTIFQLRYGEEMTIAEIGDALSMNENTVKTHLYRATNKCRKRFASEDTHDETE